MLKALIYREVKSRVGRSFTGLLADVLQIAAIIGLFILIRSYAGQQIHRNMEIGPFIATGVLNFWAFRRNALEVGQAIYGNKGLLQFPQVTPLDCAIASFLYNTMLYTAMFLLMEVIFQYFDIGIGAQDLLACIGIMFASCIFGFAFGVIIACLASYVPIIRKLNFIIMRIMIFISGTWFVIPEIPPNLRSYLLWNPVLHLNDFMRSAYFYVYDSDYASVNFVVGSGVAMLIVALVMERIVRRRVRPA